MLLAVDGRAGTFVAGVFFVNFATMSPDTRPNHYLGACGVLVSAALFGGHYYDALCEHGYRTGTSDKVACWLIYAAIACVLFYSYVTWACDGPLFRLIWSMIWKPRVTTGRVLQFYQSKIHPMLLMMRPTLAGVRAEVLRRLADEGNKFNISFAVLGMCLYWLIWGNFHAEDIAGKVFHKDVRYRRFAIAIAVLRLVAGLMLFWYCGGHLGRVLAPRGMSEVQPAFVRTGSSKDNLDLESVRFAAYGGGPAQQKLEVAN